MVNTKVTSRAVNQARVPMPALALDLDTRHGASGITLSTVTLYTTLRLLNCRRRRAGALASLGATLRSPVWAPSPPEHQPCATGTAPGVAVASFGLRVQAERHGDRCLSEWSWRRRPSFPSWDVHGDWR